MNKAILAVSSVAVAIHACSGAGTINAPRTAVEVSSYEYPSSVIRKAAEEKESGLSFTSYNSNNKQSKSNTFAEPNPVPLRENLVRHMVSKKVSLKNAELYASQIIKHCTENNVDPYTILAMIEVETGATYNAKLVGKHHEKGLLQVLPSTQKFMNVKGDLFNSSINIETGTKYLAYCQKSFGKDLGIVAYNQGEGNIRRGTYRTAYLSKVKRVMSQIKRNE